MGAGNDRREGDRYVELSQRMTATNVTGAAAIMALTLVALWGDWHSFKVVLGLEVPTIAFNSWVNLSLLGKYGRRVELVRTVVNLASVVAVNHASHWVPPVWLWLPYIGLAFDHMDRRIATWTLTAYCVVQDSTALLAGVSWLYPVSFTVFAVFCSEISRSRHSVIRAMLQSSDEQRTLLRDAEARAAAANRAKSEFLANMSHEIRTPMTAILGFGDLLLDPQLPERERAEHVRVIQRNGKHLLGLIDDVLDLSKIEADKLVLERIPCSPRQILVDVVSLFRVPASVKGLALRVDYQTAIPATMRSDPTRVRQILMNLVSNALKFTSTGGITLTARCVGADGPNPTLSFAITDTGPGIPADKLRTIFEPFSQADASTTRKFGGTGLGLTISSRLARALDGSLDLESQVGAGSTFTLTVPCGSLVGIAMLRDEQEAGSSDTSPGRRLATKLRGRVLLAEDGPDNQALISAYLKRAGASVTVAENGRIAADAATAAREAGTPFDLVLMDMQMPVLDGYGATRELRAAGYSQPIVALTAHAMAGDREKCMAAGCSDYLTKPIDRDQLTALLMKHLPLTTEPVAAAIVSIFAGDDDMKELVHGFVRNLPNRAEAVEAALSDGDVEGLRKAVHQLRGAAGGYGFPSMTDAAAVVETAISEGMDTVRLQPLVRTLADLCRRARASVAPPALAASTQGGR